MTLVKAASLLLQKPEFADVSFEVVGEEPEWSHGYRCQLEEQIARLGLGARFRLIGGVPYSGMVDLYHSSTVVVGTSRVGAIDKVPLEAMGCGKPVLLTEPAYAPVLGPERAFLLARQGDAQDVADKLAHLLSRSPEERNQLGLELRERARQQHDLKALMNRLVAVFLEEMRHRSAR
jgi:glycosyltransferase involved in cell wall biosynthesis